jgi:mono/diheme cytochrome c family protein
MCRYLFPDPGVLIMKTYSRLVLFALFARFISGASDAQDLPAAADLISNYKLHERSIKVVEPHQTSKNRYSYVEYAAVPMDELLPRMFGNEWQFADSQIVFFAKDGYRSAISSAKLTKYRAYLAFARSDTQAFTVDNIEHDQKGIELGPYYLIWANLGVEELITHGAYDWPYQVTRIELQRKNIQDKLLPQNASEATRMGMLDTEKYCLNCHSIRGIGGQKYPLDLIEASCRWQENALKAWIEAPSAIKSGTAMPALNRMLVPEEREQVITHIVNYLNALKNEQPLPCANK